MVLLSSALYWIIIGVLLLIIAAIGAFEASLIFTKAPFIPLPREILPEIVKALDLDENSILYDLGCGDCRVLIECALNSPGKKFYGVDNSLAPIWTSRYKIFRSGLNINLIKQNFFKTDLSSATHVFTYLFPALMNDLLPKLERELKPGVKLVSCDFQFKNKIPEKIINLNRPKNCLGQKLYVYKF